MKTVTVRLAGHRYPIYVGEGLLEKAGDLLGRCGFDSPPIVVTNRIVRRLHGAALLRSLEGTFGPTRVVCIGDGERFKNHATLMKIYAEMFQAHADRRSWIVAFGGGVVGDIAGFAAATFMRGIPCVMVPTTLLAQVDSSIGGKAGINVPQGKNLIGAFHQPSAVLSDTGVLETLPERELATGLFEVIKSGAIRSRPLLEFVARRLSAIRLRRPAALQHIVAASARIKADVVARDEREDGLRAILNFGHTVGHAFEAATDYRRFKHGEAVAWGMLAANAFGRAMGRPAPHDAEWLEALVRRAGSLPPLGGIPSGKVWNALARDKKFRSGNIRMVFLRRLGQAEVRGDIDAASLREFVAAFLAGQR